MLIAHNPVANSDELVKRFAEARAESDRLFAIVHRDALYERPIADRHRVVFYLGHLEAFDPAKDDGRAAGKCSQTASAATRQPPWSWTDEVTVSV